MWLWIIVAVVVLAAAVYAFWPRRRGVVDGDVRRGRKVSQGYVEQFRNGDHTPPSGGSPF